MPAMPKGAVTTASNSAVPCHEHLYEHLDGHHENSSLSDLARSQLLALGSTDPTLHPLVDQEPAAC